MSREIMDRIFDPFFTTKPVGEGTGMGLAVVHGIVSNYHGAITVQSEVGVGSTFTVYIPVVSNVPLPEMTPAQTDTHGSEAILVVDDEAAIVQLERRILEQQGYRVTISQSSLEAFNLFREDPQRFDLVISDQTMPKLTGAQLAREIMRIRPDMRVILTTGLPLSASVAQLREIGLVEYLNKPVTATHLADAVRRILDQPAPAGGQRAGEVQND